MADLKVAVSVALKADDLAGAKVAKSVDALAGGLAAWMAAMLVLSLAAS